jgi:hypothetical protein
VLWYPSCQIFSGVKILNMPSFGREVKPFVPCRRFAARKRTLFDYVEVRSQAKLVGHFSLEVPSSNRGLHTRAAWAPLELMEATKRRGVQRASIIKV